MIIHKKDRRKRSGGLFVLSRFELRVELENGGDGFLMHIFHGGEQRRIGQRLSTTHGFGQRHADGIQTVKTQVLRNALERVNGTESRFPVGLIDRSAQLVEGRIGRIFFDEPKDERFIAKPTNGIRIVTANLSIKLLSSHADVTSFPSSINAKRMNRSRRDPLMGSFRR